ncbi:MAG: signal peptide peptidase SppA [Clostridiales bacterium]|nr:signal peptide peptidase SppA [Clostridiales bacterium]
MWLIIIVVIVILALLFNSLVHNIIGKQDTTFPNKPYIGVLNVKGTITSMNTDMWGRRIGYQHDFTIKTIDRLIKDNNNKGLILFVDSPGGGIYEADELYLKLKEYKDKTNRPVYAYMASMAASGGYYVSTPADKILANRNCWTGSIGVTISTIFDISEFLERYGIKANTITAGRNKAMGSFVEPLTQEQIAIFQSLVDEAYYQFVNIVSEERDMDIDTVIEIADGRIYTAKQALDLNLVDGISSYDDTISDLKSSYGLEDCLVLEISYKDTSLFNRLFSRLPLPDISMNEAATILSLIKKDVNFPISYTCQILNLN